MRTLKMRGSTCWKTAVGIAMLATLSLAVPTTTVAFPDIGFKRDAPKLQTDTEDLFSAPEQCGQQAYPMALAKCSEKCGDGNRPCIHVCCHDQCNLQCKAGEANYWDCHRKCEEWRDPGAKESFFNPSQKSLK